jgi:hypothetical protein
MDLPLLPTHANPLIRTLLAALLRDCGFAIMLRLLLIVLVGLVCNSLFGVSREVGNDLKHLSILFCSS